VTPEDRSSETRTHSAPDEDAQVAARLAPGSSIGPYKIRALLGAGGMGEVYVARDTRLDRDVAIKVLPPAFASAVDRRRRFVHEARAAASLNHPNIVAIYDAGLGDGVPFIVMEYVRGETLSAELRRGPIPCGRALQIGSEIAAALVEAHAHNVTHRDLKPGNVMVTPGGAIKVLDFGIAKTIAPEPAPIATGEPPPDKALTHVGQLLGTPGYMSPEQLMGYAIDNRSDVYSLGVLLFELVTGQRPIPGDDPVALRHAAQSSAIPSARDVDPSVPAAVADLIAQAMTREPAARPSAEVLRADLNALLLRGATVRPDVPSVAVLSFSDMSSGRDQEVFCDGMAEELINALTRIPRLRVAARTSAFQFKGKARDVRRIGEALNVATVLDGSVRKAGDRLRVAVELIGAADGYQLWAEHFDVGVQDVFAVQDEITLSVVAALQGKWAIDPAAPVVPSRRTNVEAYGAYLEGRYHWNKRTEAELKKSVVCFERAMAQAPGYAQAHAGLADTYVTLATYGAMPARDAMPRAKEALGRALAIDRDLAQAYACRGCVHSLYDWDQPAAERDFRRAIALNPAYATAHHWYAINHLVPRGRFVEATERLIQALELDPLALAIKTSVGMTSYFAGRFDDAAQALQRTIELDERFGLAHLFLGATYTEQGRYADASAELDAAAQFSGSSPEILAATGYLHARAGDGDRARQTLDSLRQLSRERYVSPARLAQVHLGLGERGEAIDRLEEAHAERAADLAWVGVRPVFESLRTEPRFVTLLKQMGLGELLAGN
jgi:serine/threonine protein kinase/Tfp pilus assembly protein PilF